MISGCELCIHVTNLLAELSVVEAEALELLLVYGLDYLKVDRGQRRLLFGELGVEVQHVLSALLQRESTINRNGVFSHLSPRDPVHFPAPQAGLMPPQGLRAGKWTGAQGLRCENDILI